MNSARNPENFIKGEVMAKAKKVAEKAVEAPKKDSRLEALEARVTALEAADVSICKQFGLTR